VTKGRVLHHSGVIKYLFSAPSAVSLQSADSFTVLRSQVSWTILRMCGLLYVSAFDARDRPTPLMKSLELFFSWPFRKSAVVHARRPGPDCDNGQWLSDLLTSKVETIPCKWVKPSDSVASRAPRSTSNKVDNRQLEW